MAWGWLAAGCGPSPAYHSDIPVEQAPRQSGPIELELVRIAHHGDAGERRLSLDEPLRSGDEVAFEIVTRETLYVYVLNQAPDGTASVIWPADPVMVHGRQRIPAGSWFRLSGRTGQELVGIVATRRALELDRSGDRRWLHRLLLDSASQPLPRLQSVEPPATHQDGFSTMAIRAPGMRVDGGAVLGRSSDPLVVLVDIDHRPR
jgi:hypothetical protein